MLGTAVEGWDGMVFGTTMWVFPKIVVPENGWFIVENPIKMDGLGVPLFLETAICSLRRSSNNFMTLADAEGRTGET